MIRQSKDLFDCQIADNSVTSRYWCIHTSLPIVCEYFVCDCVYIRWVGESCSRHGGEGTVTSNTNCV